MGKTVIYSILQIEENAAQNESNHIYYEMARLFYPDIFTDSKEDAAEQMVKVNEAYKILSDADKKAVYDADRQLIIDGLNDNDKESNMCSEISETNFMNEIISI